MFKFIQSSNTGVIQTFGRFTGLAKPGLNLYIPFIQTITPVTNMVQNKNFLLRVKTKDNVFTDLNIGIQIKIKPEDTGKAFFSLEEPIDQIDTYVQNVVRSKVPTMTLDELFESQEDIGEYVKKNLDAKMTAYGYTIIDTLINDISPATSVAEAMNAINASERLKEATKNEADAHYIRQVKQAEGDRDRKILQGHGISGQRLAILKGYEKGVDEMANSLGLTSKDIINFVLETQRFDMLETIGTSKNAKTLFLNHHSDGLDNKIRNATIEAGQVE